MSLIKKNCKYDFILLLNFNIQRYLHLNPAFFNLIWKQFIIMITIKKQKFGLIAHEKLISIFQIKISIFSR